MFSTDKYRLAELCLRSFKESLGELRVKVWAILDDCPPEYEELFERFFAPEDLEIVRLPAVGNQATFEKQIDLLLQQRDAELVYFAEDDYFYSPGGLEPMVQYVREHEDVDFVSPYDHPDYYQLGVHRHQAEIRLFANRHWRTAGSSCLTFLTRKSTLARSQHAFRSYSRRPCSDAGVWFSLTKWGIYDPVRLLRSLVQDRFQFRILAHAWRHSTRAVLTGRRWKLWVPVPSIATHMEAAFLAPGVDWQSSLAAVVAGSGVPRGGEDL